MSVRRRIFVNKLIDNIIELITSNTELDFVKTVSSGGLEQLPSPEDLEKRDFIESFFPAIFIEPTQLYNIDVSSNKSITTTEYYFNIKYAKYHDNSNYYEIKKDAISESEILGDTLMEDNNMFTGDPKISPPFQKIYDHNGHEIGHILNTVVNKISYNTLEEEVFKELKIPIVLVDIEYQITFRSLLVR